MQRLIVRYIGLAFILTFLCSSGRAVELVTNGGFETGSFTGWTATNPSSGFRNWTVSGSGSGGNNGGQWVPVPNGTSVQQGSFNAWNGVTAGAGQSYTLTQDVVLPAGLNIKFTWMDRYQMNYTQFCTSNCGTATYAVEILNTSNVVLQTLYTVTTLTNTNSDTGWVSHVASLTAFGGTTVRLRFRTTVTQTLMGPGQLEVDAVSVQTLQPTAAAVTVSGRATSFDGRGIGGATVSIADSAGTVRTAITSSFGYYHFDNVESGNTYIVSIGNKRYLFPDSPRIVSVTDQITGLDFVASP